MNGRQVKARKTSSEEWVSTQRTQSSDCGMEVNGCERREESWTVMTHMLFQCTTNSHTYIHTQQ